jgi:hypothetical protein
MLIITLSPFVKALAILICMILYLINGSDVDQNLQKRLQAQNKTKLEYILKHPEEIKGCKL